MLKPIAKICFVSLIGVSFATISASADIAKGQKIILKKLKKSCGMNGAEIAKKHTQAEWKKIKEEKKFNEEILGICPKSKPLKSKYVDDVYDFIFEYAKDSGNVPSC